MTSKIQSYIFKGVGIASGIATLGVMGALSLFYLDASKQIDAKRLSMSSTNQLETKVRDFNENGEDKVLMEHGKKSYIIQFNAPSIKRYK